MSGTPRRALITGITGQDGSYLTELLLGKGYEVWGVLRRHSVPEHQTKRLEQAEVFDHEDLHLRYGDITDLPSLLSVMKECEPHEIYNLAAQSHVRISFDQPYFTTAADAVGILNVLEAARTLTSTKIYQACSSEMFGNEHDPDGFRRETTLMRPVSPYGCAKVYAYNLARVYRSSYNMFVSNGILFNHESPRRGLNFVTNKVVDGAVKIYLHQQDTLALGNLDATRDWGHAKDYVNAMWLMLQEDYPGDFVCATGISHSIRELCEYVFSCLNLNYEEHITVDPKHFRPTELHDLRGDASKAKEVLDWEHEYSFETLLDEMIAYKLKELDPSAYNSVLW